MILRRDLPRSHLFTWCAATKPPPLQVSFGIFDLEADAARQYDRALILEKGRSAKTNFPLRDYQREVAEYEAYVLARWVLRP